jgi:hypothetical protein
MNSRAVVACFRAFANHQKATMNNPQSTHRTLDYLISILDEPSDWTVRGEGGMSLASTASLRGAVVRAMVCQATQWRVISIALCRKPDDDIVVFLGQINRLSLELDDRSAAAA